MTISLVTTTGIVRARLNQNRRRNMLRVVAGVLVVAPVLVAVGGVLVVLRMGVRRGGHRLDLRAIP